MQLTVPVKPHVKEFFQSIQILGSEPLEVRRNSRIGQIVVAIFSAYPLDGIDEAEEDLEPIETLDPEYLHLRLMFDFNQALVTDSRLQSLGNLLEVVYEFYAIAFCKGRMSILPSLNGAAVHFTEAHKLKLDSYSSDAVRKLVDRSQPKRRTIHENLSATEKRNVSNFRERVSKFA